MTKREALVKAYLLRANRIACKVYKSEQVVGGRLCVHFFVMENNTGKKHEVAPTTADMIYATRTMALRTA